MRPAPFDRLRPRAGRPRAAAALAAAALAAAALAAAALAACWRDERGTDAPVARAARPPEAAPHACLVDPPGRPVPYSCPRHSCGNAARIYGSIVEALDVRGALVATLLDPYRLVRGTLAGAGGACRGRTGLSLEVRDGGFVGVAGGPDLPRVVCSGADLVGATFEVERRLPPRPGTRLTIAISHMTSVPVWSAGQPAASVPAYDLRYRVSRELPPVSLCDAAPWSGDGDGARLPGDLDEWRVPSQHAVLLQGETYGADAAIARTGAHWFNLGCAGSAIAKLRLFGLDPMRTRPAGTPPNGETTTADERVATLKMLTAKYCGAASWTRAGTRVFMRHRDDPPASSEPGSPGPRVGPIEAQWGSGGALCVSHLRAWAAGSQCAAESEAAAVAAIRSQCGIPACDEAQPCGVAAAPDGALWTTCTDRHVSHGAP